MIKLPNLSALITINENFTGLKVSNDRLERFNSCFSSYFYYDSEFDQISSIVLAIIKNHYFIDANKRTALIAFLSLAYFNDVKISLSLKELESVFIKIAANHYTVQQVSKLLFA